jgi:hypothetical protein
MTLALAAFTKNSIWLLTDRRLTHSSGCVDDAGTKAIILSTGFDTALLGYAGLIRTALGMEPSVWMANTLTGRKLTLEQSLSVLVDALKARVGPHLSGHITELCIVASAVVSGKPLFYGIGIGRDSVGANRLIFQRFLPEMGTRQINTTTLIKATGSGAVVLANAPEKLRELRRVLRAHERGDMTARRVADYMASLNAFIHSRTNSVGPSCIVIWRPVAAGTGDGGAHLSFVGRSVEPSTPHVPHIMGGNDMNAFCNLMFARLISAGKVPESLQPSLLRMRGTGNEVVNTGDLNAELAKLPDKPNDALP